MADVRILHHFPHSGFDPQAETGGHVVRAARLVDGLRALGHEVVMLDEPIAARDGVRSGPASSPRQRPGWMPERAWLAVRDLRRELHHRRHATRLEAEVRRFRPNLLLETHDWSSGAGVRVSARTGVPLVVDDLYPIDDLLRLYGAAVPAQVRRRRRRLLRSGALLVAVTESVRDRLIAEGADASRIVVVGNGVIDRAVDPSSAAIARLATGARSSGEPVAIGFVGSFQPFHRLDLLVDAVSELVARQRDVRLVLVGAGVLEPELRQRVAAATLSDRVEFVGAVPIDQVAGQLARFDIAAMPATDAHTSPMKLFEYLAAGVPVVAPDQSNVREIVADGVDGILFNPGDACALADAVERVLDRAASGTPLSPRSPGPEVTWTGRAQVLSSAFSGAHMERSQPIRRSAVGPGWRARVSGAVLRLALLVIDRTVRRGYLVTSRTIGRLAGPGAWVEVVQPGGARFRVPMTEGYWLRRLWCDHSYEPEMVGVIADLMGRGAKFLDCGANYGWWSVYASAHASAGAQADPSTVVAVEAGVGPLARLRGNVALNPYRITVLHRALWTVDGETIEFAENFDHPEVSSIAGVADEHMTGARGIVKVETVCLDTLLSAVDPATLCAIKLDVEGVEVEVLSASKLIECDTVALLYEDHGRYPGCEVSAWLLERGWRIYAPDDDGVCRSLSSVAEIRSLKTDVLKGYNFIAVRPDGPADTVVGAHRDRS